MNTKIKYAYPEEIEDKENEIQKILNNLKRIKKIRICPNCKKQFVANSTIQVFCDPICSSLYSKRNN